MDQLNQLRQRLEKTILERAMDFDLPAVADFAAILRRLDETVEVAESDDPPTNIAEPLRVDGLRWVEECTGEETVWKLESVS